MSEATSTEEALDPISARSLAVVQDMESGLARYTDEFGDFFHEKFRWMGNYGCGTKDGLQAFVDHWVAPFRAAFSDRTYITERFIAQGAFVSCFGHQEATHTGPFMGVAPTGKRVRIPYMDFWEVRDGKIVDNWVSVDFPLVLAQLGVDVFNGHGWEKLDTATS